MVSGDNLCKRSGLSLSIAYLTVETLCLVKCYLKKPSCISSRIQTLSNMAPCLPAPGDGVHHDHPLRVARVEPGVVDQPPAAPRLHHGAVAWAGEGAVNTLHVKWSLHS